jgi:tetratricopeptide (TPR) repeat protein
MEMTTAELAADTPAQQDERWVEGMDYLQEGSWKAAVRCFEGLVQAYPDDVAALRALDQARFKAELDRKGRGGGRGKRWIIPWRVVIVRSLTVVVVALLGFLAWRLIVGHVVPAVERWREQRELARLRSDANSFFESGDLDQSEGTWNKLLARVPGDEEAVESLDRIAAEREVQSRYNAAVAAQEAGESTSALEQFTDLQLLRPGYRDINQRIADIRRQQAVEELSARASDAFDVGQLEEALALYERLRALDVGYRPDFVKNRLYSLHVEVGLELLNQIPPAAERVPEALDHFEAALMLRPGDSVAEFERQLAESYLSGQERYQAGDWQGAVGRLRTVYDQRPGYLGGLVASMLYESYINNGDQYKEGASQDCAFAFQQYDQASRLPVEDTTLAERRKLDVLYCIPPTPTPTDTPTPTPTPTPPRPPTNAPTRRPTATPTPWALAALHNQILFKQVDGSNVYYQDEVDEATLWVMNPDGTKRRQLGPFDQYEGQFEELYEQYTRSPDGRYRAYTNARNQIAIELPPSPEWPAGTAQVLTSLTGICYDPQWSPDGGRIVFVSAEGYSDDIWVMSADGSNATQLTSNFWEWEKHPAWSPDSQKIVFWSNRNGLAQIYVMDAAGRYPTNISQQSEFNEFDPIWIR